MPSSLGKILLNFLHILNLFMPLWYFVFKQQKVKNLKLEHKCPRTKLLEPRTIAYFSVFFYCREEPEREKVKKTEGLPHRGERLREISFMLMTKIYE